MPPTLIAPRGPDRRPAGPFPAPLSSLCAAPLSAFCAAAAALALVACSPDGEPQAPPPVSAAGPETAPVDPDLPPSMTDLIAAEEPPVFETRDGLVEAIEAGEFAERTGTDDRIALLRAVPDPVEVAFVAGTDVPVGEVSKLVALSEAMLENPDLIVRIVGCSDPSGPATLNLSISTARAESVAERLIGMGVERDRIPSVEGRGEACAVPERVVHLTPALAEDARAEALGRS